MENLLIPIINKVQTIQQRNRIILLHLAIVGFSNKNNRILNEDNKVIIHTKKAVKPFLRKSLKSEKTPHYQPKVLPSMQRMFHGKKVYCAHPKINFYQGHVKEKNYNHCY